MKRRFLMGVCVLAVVAAGVYASRGMWSKPDPLAHAPARVRAVSVQAVTADRRQVPVDVDAIGTVSPIASVALKSRVETTITSVEFSDGARVNAGDVLFKLDSRQIDAQIEQAEGALARDRAQLAGAERDFKRYTELIAKGATTQVNLDNAKTQSDVLKGTVAADQSMLDNLKVQKSFTVITAPISGRISAAAVKEGNFVRPADIAPLATINQIAPIYVMFSVPQRVLSDLRDAIKDDTSKVVASLPNNDRKSEQGKVAMIENSVDSSTGMVAVRAIMDNTTETLWPGTLVSTKLTIRTEEAVVVPSVTVQRSQTGNYVFLIKDGKASVQPVKVNRTFQGFSVIETGLSGGESVVTDGQLLLSNGTPVEIRANKAGA